MSSWRRVALEEVVTVGQDRVEPQSRPTTSFNYVGLEHIEGHSGRLLTHERTSGLDIKSTKNVFRSGDVLYGKLRPYLNKVHLAEEDGICSTDIYVLKPNPDRIVPAYAAYFLRSAIVLEQVGNLMEGANLPRLSHRNLLGISIPLPPLPEQKRIVRILDEAEELRRLRAESDRRTADLIPAIFHDMFGDPKDILKMPWPMYRLDSLADVSYGLADKLDTSTTASQGTRIITISNVTLSGSLDLSVERYSVVRPDKRAKARLQDSDLLFNWRNGSKEHVGKTAIWEGQIAGEVLHVSFLLRIRPDRGLLEPYYLRVLLGMMRASGFFTRESRMQINRKYNASELSALLFPLPPLPLQRTFAARVAEVRTMEAEQDQSRADGVKS